jgi:hypothetical protein
MVGLWLFISPVILGYGAQDAVALDAVAWNFIFCGLAIVTISVLTLFWYRSSEKWADIVIGVWPASSAWTMNFSDMVSARLNAVVMGIIFVATALWMISDGPRPFHTS